MKKFKWFIVILLIFSLGCVTVPIKPITQNNVTDLVGTWRGSMSLSAYGEKSIDLSFRRSLKLEIYNSNLIGKVTFPSSKDQIERYPFNGKIEGGRLVAYWKNGSWMKLNLREDSGKITLEGDYDFSRFAGTVSLEKVQ
jgi:hypothetical protein